MLTTIYRASVARILRNAGFQNAAAPSCHFSTTQANLESSSTKSITAMEDLKMLKYAPQPALVLGISGLIPFLAAPWYMTHHGVFVEPMLSSQLAYGASILSFLGGVRWGNLVVPSGPIKPNWLQYGYSVTPSLIAWSALLMPTVPGVVTCAAGLGLAAYADLIEPGYPSWFRGLRVLLTSVALFSLTWSLLCKAILDDQKTKDEKLKAKELVKEEPSH